MIKNYDKEKWEDVEGYKGLYQISSCARLKHLPFEVNIKNQFGDTQKIAYHKERIQKPNVDKYGYQKYTLCKHDNEGYSYKYITAHRLVAEAFIPNKTTFKSMPNEDRNKIDLDKLEINHKDENKLNNCAENLEWCTQLYNIHYGTRIKRSGDNGRIKIIQKTKDNKILKVWDSLTIASETLNINKGRICCCCKGKAKSAGGYRWEYYKEKK